jgi:RHS repeat-associated protein
VDAIAEYNGSNALQRRFVFGPGVDEPIVQYEGSGTTDRRFMSADERGSVIATTNSSGALLTINRYDEYGKPQSTNSGRFQYTGQKWIGELGLYDYKARDYLPHLGIFAQTDPIGYGASANLYAYVGADPVNLTDPGGLCNADGSPSYAGENCDPIIVTGNRFAKTFCEAFWACESSGGIDVGFASSFGPGGIGGAGPGGMLGSLPKGPPPPPPPPPQPKPQPACEFHGRAEVCGANEKRSQCAAAVSGVAAYSLVHLSRTSETVKVGTSIYRGILLGRSVVAGAEVGAAAGGGIFSLEGVIAGGIVGGVVYYLDQQSQNSAAKRLEQSGFEC